MPVTINRHYIDASQFRSSRLTFRWDEWNVSETYEPADPEIVARLERISRRANCAFTIAIGEWILARFDGLDNDLTSGLFLEAAWAANVDLRYSEELAIVDDEWRGPVRGPISMALTFVIDALFAEEAGPNSAMNPAWAGTFARHVLPDTTAFDSWFGVCLNRISSLYPAPNEDDLDWFDVENNWGALVPSEVFDPSFAFQPHVAADLIDAYLGRLDPAANPFLRSPAEILADGFFGTPYRYLPPRP